MKTGLKNKKINWKEAHDLQQKLVISYILENEKLKEALDRIARPVWWMQEDQKRKTGSINGIDGGMAAALSESAEYLKCIARKALEETK